ncbi:hypothetical protein [Methanosarcina acetivorans]|uniref:Uncharacterized protein n=1 Tax=Methanosarcina acetivorans (strain ATCC 35395 / DSM 2834 / JCM 12185 / C2A) TaxID=188937 RepID=Q8TLU7_METAC|nr:hypothetical protein [Methanosarcina acetivorans]AAM06303.1 predicted protein [Methanosarcina acetivorans C2A]
MDFKIKPTKKIVASGFIFLMLLALLATGASAADQLRDRDQIKDPDQDRLRDGSCQSSAVSTCIGDCDQTQDRLRDGSCQSSEVSTCTGDCDQTQDRDQDKDQTQDRARDRDQDGSCLE